MKALKFAWRSLWRDLKSGELAILAFALVVAVAAVATVGIFTDRVERAMERQAGDILAADLVLQARSEPAAAYTAEARERGLQTAARWSFASVIVAGDEIVLANVKAVSDGYPLRGAVQVSDELFGERRVADGIPDPGTVWLDSRLFAQLGIRPGDEVGIGEARFTAARVLEFTPDEGFGFTSMAPALLVNMQDIPGTQLINVGSRVQYRQLFAGDQDAIDGFAGWLTDRMERTERLLNARDERPELGNALDRASRFLGLAAIVSVLLAAIAVATAARRYASRHLDAIAVIKCVGGSQDFVLGAYALQVMMIGVIGSVIGIAIGMAAQYAMVELMSGLLSLDDLPPPGATGALAAALVGIVVLVGFALPPLLPLRRVPPARVLRRDLAPPPLSAWAAYSVAGAAIGVLLWLQTRDLALTLWTAAGAAATVMALAIGAWLLLKVLAGMRGRVGVAWRYGLANIARRRRESIAQMVAFGLGIMVVLLLAIVRTDLMAGWQEVLTDDAPNHFLINIQDDQHAELESVFRA
jgi:putative ABC transport system permease protein